MTFILMSLPGHRNGSDLLVNSVHVKEDEGFRCAAIGRAERGGAFPLVSQSERGGGGSFVAATSTARGSKDGVIVATNINLPEPGVKIQLKRELRTSSVVGTTRCRI